MESNVVCIQSVGNLNPVECFWDFEFFKSVCIYEVRKFTRIHGQYGERGRKCPKAAGKSTKLFGQEKVETAIDILWMSAVCFASINDSRNAAIPL